MGDGVWEIGLAGVLSAAIRIVAKPRFSATMGSRLEPRMKADGYGFPLGWTGWLVLTESRRSSPIDKSRKIVGEKNKKCFSYTQNVTYV